MNIKDEICDEEVGGGEVDCDVLLEEHNFKVPSLVNSSLNQMFCIEAPAKVENLNNFVRCCGGIRSLESILFTPKSRLQFKFRPDDPNSVPLFSGRKSSTDLVVKVRRKKKPDGTHDYKFETVGVIDTTFHFEDKICDLQLLPTSSDIRNELLKSDFILNGPASKVTVDKDNSVTIMKHFFYSRFTTPRAVFFEMSEQSKQEPNNPDVICQLRKPRRMFGSFVKWESETVPESLSEEHKSRIPEATSNDPVLIKIKELFDQRPVWSRHALLVLTKCRNTKLKYLLPMFAFCYLNGPFRNLWVRYGYNPKLDKSSKMYQSIECRYRSLPTESMRCKVTLFKDHSVSYLPDSVSPFHYLDESRVSTASGDRIFSEDAPHISDDDYIFRPGHISIFNRAFYQICDIDVPEVKQIIAENDGQEVECTEKDGWCSKDAIDRIRKIMVEIANKTCYEATGSHFDPKITLSDLEQAETEDQLMIEDENF